jgi:hypothetical protein
MEKFDALHNIDNFCKVLVKRGFAGRSEAGNKMAAWPAEAHSTMDDVLQPEIEDPLIDIFDEKDYVRILVQCRCREQQVTFHPNSDGITVCREECHKEKNGSETCRDICRKLTLRTDNLQLDDMEFVIAKCNNNNTLEAMIPKLKNE